MPARAQFDLDTMPLGEAIELKRGISWRRAMERDGPYPGTWPVLGIGNVRQRLVLDDLVYLAGITPDRARACAATRGWTILVASNGNPQRVGNPVFIEEDRGFLFASFLIAVAPKPGSGLLPKFLYWFLKTPRVQQAITRSVQGTTGLKNLGRKVLDELPLPRYTPAEQRRIVDILDAQDETIRNTDTLIAKLRAVKTGLVDDLFTRGVEPDGRLRDVAFRPGESAESPLGPIPRGWNVVELGSCFAGLDRYPSYYGIRYLQRGVPEVRGELIGADGRLEEDRARYRRVDEATAGRFPKVRLQAGDLVMSVRGTLGKVALVPPWLRGAVITANLIRMRPDRSRIVPRWARHFLCSRFFQDALELAASATTVETIQVPRLRAIRLRLPPIDEQVRIAEILDAHDEQLRAERSYREKLDHQRTGLMHDLLDFRRMAV